MKNEKRKSLTNGLKSRFLGLVGFIKVCGGLRFFNVSDAADRGAIGVKWYYHAKVGSFRDCM